MRRGKRGEEVSAGDCRDSVVVGLEEHSCGGQIEEGSQAIKDELVLMTIAY